MRLVEEKRDLFDVSEDYYLAHCISADFALGAGIAKELNKRYNMRTELNSIYGTSSIKDNLGKALLVGRTFNLVTKERYWHKPTYASLRTTLVDMRMQVLSMQIKKLAMPLIGCGLDKLQWEKVKTLIEEIFSDDDLEIIVCRK